MECFGEGDRIPKAYAIHREHVFMEPEGVSLLARNHSEPGASIIRDSIARDIREIYCARLKRVFGPERCSHVREPLESGPPIRSVNIIVINAPGILPVSQVLPNHRLPSTEPLKTERIDNASSR